MKIRSRIILGIAVSFCITVNFYASQTTINGPTGSGKFGYSVTMLSNGNFVVADPNFSIPGENLVGAAYLYNGVTFQLISTLTGSKQSDKVGLFIQPLANGNFLVKSPNWSNGAATNAGAVTFCSGTTGCSGAVSQANSLVGSNSGDSVGGFTFGSPSDIYSSSVLELPNGNLVVISPDWDNGGVANAGAITWCSGSVGCVGPVGASNSIIGANADDRVGGGGVMSLANSNYVVLSPQFGLSDVGAVTLGDGSTGASFTVSSSNSLVGDTLNDGVGSSAVRLPSGNFLVQSYQWHGRGAVTFSNSSSMAVGALTATNSLVGSTPNDLGIGSTVQILRTGNYLVRAPGWDNGASIDAGAVVWGDGNAGVAGTISTSNALVGSSANDQVGFQPAVEVGNFFLGYVIPVPDWDSGAIVNAGAARWCNSTAGCSGTISSSNSVVGTTANDAVGRSITVLSGTTHAYVIAAPDLDEGAVVDIGAVRWCNGNFASAGAMTTTNSLFGRSANDRVGSVTALSSGDFLVSTPDWDFPVGPIANVGVVTWRSGTASTQDRISTSNSIFGLNANDRVSSGGIVKLTSGNAVIVSPNWNSAGAITWINGWASTGTSVDTGNSLYGGSAIPNSDLVGVSVTALANGNYVVMLPSLDQSPALDLGGVAVGDGFGPSFGPFASSNTVIGSNVNDLQNAQVTALSGGGFVLSAPKWGLNDLGIVRVFEPGEATGGVFNSTNSMVGTTANDRIGSSVGVFTDGNFAVYHYDLDSPPTGNTGAVTVGGKNGKLIGAVTANNSVAGQIANPFPNLSLFTNPVHEYYVCTRMDENKITIIDPVRTAVKSNLGWDDDNTWDFGQFAKAHDILIPQGITVIGNTDPVAKSLVVNGSFNLIGPHTATSDIDINGTMNINSGSLSMNGNKVKVACAGTLNTSGPSGYLIGKLEKTFCSPSSYFFANGTASGYAPVSMTITNGLFPASVSVESLSPSIPGLADVGKALKRYWRINGSNVTANVEFNYNDPPDVPIGANESLFKIWKKDGAFSQVVGSVDTNLNSATVNGITSFSEWTLGEAAALFPPVGSTASLSGRVSNVSGRGIRNATLTLTDTNSGAVQSIRSGVNGTFRFDSLVSGHTFTVAVSARRFGFSNPSRTVNVTHDIGNVNFTSFN